LASDFSLHCAKFQGKALTQTQRSRTAEIRIAECLEVVAKTMGQRQQQSIMGRPIELERSAHPKTESAPDQDKRDVVQRMGIAFP
jgi:hypothetical protein